MNDREQISAYKNGLLQGDSRILAKVITLIESQRKEDHELKFQLLQSLQDIRKPSVKIGITGSPGVGKSTFLNSFVSMFHNSSSRIAILTIDPTSSQSGGSILGDKLRMENLLDMNNVYIRPSPSKGILGGITTTTWETIHVCEAAGFNYIFIETVGVGQSEIEVQYLTNEVWYLTMASSGDEIQGIKRGILEVADRIIITKRDLDPEGTQKTKALLQQALQVSNKGKRKILMYKVSALQPESLESLYNDLMEIPTKSFTKTQENYWFDRGWQETLLRFIDKHPTMQVLLHKLKTDMNSGRLNHWTAMSELKKELEKLWGE